MLQTASGAVRRETFRKSPSLGWRTYRPELVSVEEDRPQPVRTPGIKPAAREALPLLRKEQMACDMATD